MNYKQLTQEERYQIYALIKANHNQKDIARILRRSCSSISRELKRNTGFGLNKLNASSMCNGEQIDKNNQRS